MSDLAEGMWHIETAWQRFGYRISIEFTSHSLRGDLLQNHSSEYAKHIVENGYVRPFADVKPIVANVFDVILVNGCIDGGYVDCVRLNGVNSERKIEIVVKILTVRVY